MRLMRIMMRNLLRGSAATQSEAIMGIFVTVRKCPRMVEPAMSMSTMQAVRKDSATDLKNPLSVRSFLRTDKRRTAKVPTLPASVGRKNPFMRPPTTKRKIRTIHPTSGRELILSNHVDLFPFGPRDGLLLHQP